MVDTLARWQAGTSASFNVPTCQRANVPTLSMNITVDQLLTEMVRRDGSDLILKADNHPLFRIYGDLVPYEQVPRLTGRQV
ncbi:MAG: hypothetical protein RMK49_21015, partial [Abditibacteriales bacterium]|nr:hypothetical protein [Abditibacteriales bacterium]